MGSFKRVLVHQQAAVPSSASMSIRQDIKPRSTKKVAAQQQTVPIPTKEWYSLPAVVQQRIAQQAAAQQQAAVPFPINRIKFMRGEIARWAAAQPIGRRRRGGWLHGGGGVADYPTDPERTDIDTSGEQWGDDLPIDLQERLIVSGADVAAASSTGGLLKVIADNTGILVDINTIRHGLVGRAITVGITPTRIIQNQFKRAYIIMNPSLVIGTTAYGTLAASAVRTVDGNTQASPLGVANYRDMHLFLNVSAIAGASPSVDFYAQALDPVTLTWFDTQQIWSAIGSVGANYINIGGLGLSTDFAVRWDLSAGTTSITFSIGYVLKEGLPGTGAGVGKTIYLGNSGVTSVAGFPLLEGQSRAFYMEENVELWAVAGASLDLRVFEL